MNTTNCSGFPECFRFCGCQVEAEAEQVEAEAERDPKCKHCLVEIESGDECAVCATPELL